MFVALISSVIATKNTIYLNIEWPWLALFNLLLGRIHMASIAKKIGITLLVLFILLVIAGGYGANYLRNQILTGGVSTDALPEETTVGVSGEGGMVVGTTGAQAQQIGVDILKRGGNAMDAAIATAMGQITLASGAWVSFAGISTVVYYEAATGKVYNLNAAFNTVKGETDYEGVPGLDLSALSGGGENKAGHHNGRTVPVPGFMRGMEAAQKRFGALGWGDVIQPSIDLAEQGFEVNKGLAGQFAYRKDILSKFPETKAVVFKDENTLYQEGDLYKQPALANTLRNVVEHGADYMYTGPWAEKFVAAVQGIGGRITMDDMKNYQANWVEPVKSSYGNYDIYAHGLPAYGGVNLVEAMNLIEAADLASSGPYTESAETLFWLSQIVRNGSFRGFEGTDAEVEAYMQRRTTQAHADALWKEIKADGGFKKSLTSYAPNHSDGVVTVDAEGNMVAMLHSINAVTFGETGLIVGGVSVPDALTNQLDVAKVTEPGTRLPDPGAPVLIVKNGQPFGVFSTIGAGLHPRLVNVLFNIMSFDMTPQEALNAPSLGFTLTHPSSYFGEGAIGSIVNSLWGNYQTISSGQIDPNIIEQLENMGLDIVYNPQYGGYVVGITIDPKTGLRHGGTIEKFGGRAVGY